MSSKNDQVFQLSLTEIAFMLTFLLMLVLGLLVVKANSETTKLRSIIEASSSIEDQVDNLTKAKDMLLTALQAAGVSGGEDVLSRLVNVSEAKAETERLKVLVDEKDKTITSMVELEKMLEQMSGESNLGKDQIMTSLVMMSQLGEQLGAAEHAADLERELKSILETSRIIEEYPTDADLDRVEKARMLVEIGGQQQALNKEGVDPLQLKKENANLRGQMVYLQNKLDARGGRDYPPCWADEATGKTQLLFSLHMRNDSLTVSPAWPESRKDDAGALPNMSNILAHPEVSYEQFMNSARQIYELSNRQACRHFVLLDNTISDAVLSDRRRLLIEGIFYKIEKRR